ncbi:MAG: hypothetical protein H8E87_03600 [FCB group bacterium]|nr:hypothetical protein [FCB group bacterium]
MYIILNTEKTGLYQYFLCCRVPALCSIPLFPYSNKHSHAGAWEREEKHCSGRSCTLQAGVTCR